jgi:hypothetical protein
MEEKIVLSKEDYKLIKTNKFFSGLLSSKNIQTILIGDDKEGPIILPIEDEVIELCLRYAFLNLYELLAQFQKNFDKAIVYDLIHPITKEITDSNIIENLKDWVFDYEESLKITSEINLDKNPLNLFFLMNLKFDIDKSFEIFSDDEDDNEILKRLPENEKLKIKNVLVGDIILLIKASSLNSKNSLINIPKDSNARNLFLVKDFLEEIKIKHFHKIHIVYGLK